MKNTRSQRIYNTILNTQERNEFSEVRESINNLIRKVNAYVLQVQYQRGSGDKLDMLFWELQSTLRECEDRVGQQIHDTYAQSARERIDSA
jgi:hypothetical protein